MIPEGPLNKIGTTHGGRRMIGGGGGGGGTPVSSRTLNVIKKILNVFVCGMRYRSIDPIWLFQFYLEVGYSIYTWSREPMPAVLLIESISTIAGFCERKPPVSRLTVKKSFPYHYRERCLHIHYYIMAGHEIVIVKDITLLFYHGNAVILAL